ncbi:CoA-binding protein [Paenibacillus endoradicis]|uniref:CoA-binding protein n=1 Tax=Paenibacillus endoradicis TaxID=2972487 RepID=UPI00215959B2|nr:CoA-binding protein [Paenibacillus endoradicis]MCR8656054.1 CoA-binding protein [Paenibacillus endoradicis]MCR8658380.1 CoA-binding protein [Paenibacillus endoradicis]
MAFENPSRDEIKNLLSQTKVIAVVGLSDNRERISYMVSEAMKKKGYTIVPVNPKASEILDETCYPSLSDIPFPIDLVNVFRRSEYTAEIAEEAVRVGAKALWLQLGVFNQEAADIAIEGGLAVIMDRCIKVEDSILLPQGK